MKPAPGKKTARHSGKAPRPAAGAKASPAPAPSPPGNRELRTRKDLLQAASRLMAQGRKPGMDEVAREALVSRATAYRYFPNVETILAEAPVDAATTGAVDHIFDGDTSTDVAARVDAAEAAMHEVVYSNEAALRLMLAHAVTRPLDPKAAGGPVRQNRRVPLIHAALAPARQRLSKADYDTLSAALALLFGPEAMIVFQDVLRIDPAKARQVKSWAARALVHAALSSPE